jgi:membrane carboxypeptidase/penicillin-binding protein PbpC
VGAQAAAPVALSIIERMQKGREEEAWLRRSDDIMSAVVCLETGLPPNGDCPTTRVAQAVRLNTGRAAVPEPCAVHRRVTVDSQTGELLCARCAQGHARHDEVCAVWPTRLAAWMRQQGIRNAGPPRHYSGCKTAGGMAGPKITSPASGDSFVLTGGRPPEAQKIALSAAAPPSSETLYWFVDGELLEVSEPGAVVHLVPRAGRHQVRVSDDLGRADTASFLVEQD